AMRDSGRGGSIVNISSIHEDVAFPGFTSYCVSKGGMRMLMRNAAVEQDPGQQRGARSDRHPDQRRNPPGSGEGRGGSADRAARADGKAGGGRTGGGFPRLR